MYFIATEARAPETPTMFYNHLAGMSLAFIKVGGHLVQARIIRQEITVKTNHSGAPGEKAIGRS